MMVLKVVRQALIFGLLFSLLSINQAWGEKDCYGEKDSIIYNCRKTLAIHTDWVDPSNECRHIVEKSDIMCICSILVPHDEIVTRIDKFFRLAHFCGKQIPEGTKCGRKYLKSTYSFEKNCGI